MALPIPEVPSLKLAYSIGMKWILILLVSGAFACAGQGGTNQSTCQTITCKDLGQDCGTAGDGCGRLLQCGSCTAPQFCGGGGINKCGGDTTLGPDSPAVKPVAIAAGLFSTCVLLSNGTAKCWGYNTYGQLGDGTHTDSLTPVAVQGLTGAIAIAAWDGYHACALLSNSTAQCWGSNLYGDIGNGTAVDSATIKTVSNLSNIANISAGGNYTCAALLNGSAACWGKIPTAIWEPQQ